MACPTNTEAAKSDGVWDVADVEEFRGFRGLTAPDPLKEQAVRYLRLWLSDDAFAAYRPQIAWLIEQRQWAGLLDRFYQILPFGTGGRRGPVGVNRCHNRRV